MLRVFNNTARYVDQGGNKRPGAFAIFVFLDLRKNHGKEEQRATDLFYAMDSRFVHEEGESRTLDHQVL